MVLHCAIYNSTPRCKSRRLCFKRQNCLHIFSRLLPLTTLSTNLGVPQKSQKWQGEEDVCYAAPMETAFSTLYEVKMTQIKRNQREVSANLVLMRGDATFLFILSTTSKISLPLSRMTLEKMLNDEGVQNINICERDGNVIFRNSKWSNDFSYKFNITRHTNFSIYARTKTCSNHIWCCLDWNIFACRQVRSEQLKI